MFGRKKKTIAARTAAELDAMEAAGRIVAATLCAVRDAARPGISTAELDALAEQAIREAGAIPSFLGYHGFSGSICASVNDVVVHGIPSGDVILKEGDLVSIDCGAVLDGWHGDSAVTFGVGELSLEDSALNDATRFVLDEGIAAMVPGARLTDISAALGAATAAARTQFHTPLFIVDGYGGHGIGRSMHEDPFLPNEGKAGRGPVITEGSVLAIEPMLTAGTVETCVDDDDWTVRTTDGSRAAHWEHTVAATADGPRILTPRLD